mgnify:CR=1 FL=1
MGPKKVTRMPVLVDGIEFLTLKEVVDAVGITRQTLWRWRQEGKIPAGHRFRARHVVFTPDEMQQIERYANRIDSIDTSEKRQRDLFCDQ